MVLDIQKFLFIVVSSIVQSKYTHNTVHLSAFKTNSQTYKVGLRLVFQHRGYCIVFCSKFLKKILRNTEPRYKGQVAMCTQILNNNVSPESHRTESQGL